MRMADSASSSHWRATDCGWAVEVTDGVAVGVAVATPVRVWVLVLVAVIVGVFVGDIEAVAAEVVTAVAVDVGAALGGTLAVNVAVALAVVCGLCVDTIAMGELVGVAVETTLELLSPLQADKTMALRASAAAAKKVRNVMIQPLPPTSRPSRGRLGKFLVIPGAAVTHSLSQC